MAKESNQKLKIVYLMKIFLEKTDETHSITMSEIISSLESYGVKAERKSIYSDMEYLRQYGLDIIGEQQDGGYRYFVANRQFELAELKILVDTVQAAKFITTKKSRELIKKIEGLASKYEAQQLQRQVYMSDRIKTNNENIFYNVDDIHTAIAGNSEISFQYFKWDINKKMVPRREGKNYVVSPWGLSWDDENYYLIAFDGEEEKIKHFRVDKILHIKTTGNLRQGQEQFKQFDMGRYAKKMFGMYSGDEQIVTLECENEMIGVLVDRFGKDIPVTKKDEEHFLTKVKVSVSRQFLSWVISLGDGIKIVSPEEVVDKMKSEIERLKNQYM